MFRLYLDALRGSRRRAAVCVLLFAVSGLLEGLGIASLLPFLQGSLSGESKSHEYFGLRGDDLAVAALVSLVVLGAFAAVVRYIADVKLYQLWASVEASMRERMTRAVFGMRWSSFSTRSFGDSAKAVLNDGQQVGQGVHGLVSGLGYGMIAVVFVAVAAVISIEMTAITLAFGAGTVLVYRAAGKRAERRGTKLSSQATVVTDLVDELFNNFKFYRSTGLSASAVDRARDVYTEWRDDFVRVWRYQPATRLGFDVAGLVFITAVLAVAVLVIGNSAAEAFVFLALFYRLSPRLQLAQQGMLVAKAQSAWWTAWKKRYDAAAADADTRTGTVRLTDSPTIVVQEATFTYPGRPEPAVDRVSWTLPKGACVAIVGESGSGKTTMLDLVTGLLLSTSGSITLDGTDIRDVQRDSWQHHIGLVMQDAPTFFGSVLDNITWGAADRDRDKALRCAEHANMADVIAALPEGLDSPVGQHGSALSGGQRQRLALARALYREPWLLVLDEATSALDTESEQAIQRALVGLKGTCSILLVAHRLKTVEMADSIVVLSHGAVVESGTWAELAAASGLFSRMATAQRLEPGVGGSRVPRARA